MIQKNFKQVISFIEKQNYVVKESLMQKLNIEKKLVKLYQNEIHKLKEVNNTLKIQLEAPFNKDKTLSILKEIKVNASNYSINSNSNLGSNNVNVSNDIQVGSKKLMLSIFNNNNFTIKSARENHGMQPFLIIERGNEDDKNIIDDQDEGDDLCISCVENVVSDELVFSCNHKFCYCFDCYKKTCNTNKIHKKRYYVNCPSCKDGEAIKLK